MFIGHKKPTLQRSADKKHIHESTDKAHNQHFL